MQNRSNGFRVEMFLLLATLNFVGCVEREVPVNETPPAEVTISQPVVQEFPEFREFTGRVQAEDDVDIRARVTGYITEVGFFDGDLIEKDAMLFQIDRRPYEIAERTAKSEVDRWQALLKKAKAESVRMEKLLKTGARTVQDLEQAQAEEAEAAASLDGAGAAVGQAELDLEFTKIIAPISGRISRANLTEGNLITGDLSLGAPLTTIVSVDPIHVYFDVDEYTLLEVTKRIREKDPNTTPDKIRESNWPVYIGLANEEGFPHTGYLDFAENRVDSGTGTIRLRAKFKNETRYLAPGFFVRVRFPISDEGAKHILVPEFAIGTDLNLKYVYVVNEKDIVERRPVKLGIRTEDGLQAIKSGVTADDWVITNGMQRVRETDTVVAKKIPIAVAEPTEKQPEKMESEKPAQPDQQPDKASKSDKSS